jgi:hypothetical protein
MQATNAPVELMHERGIPAKKDLLERIKALQAGVQKPRPKNTVPVVNTSAALPSGP